MNAVKFLIQIYIDMSLADSPATDKEVSSAYIAGIYVSKPFGKSFI